MPKLPWALLPACADRGDQVDSGGPSPPAGRAPLLDSVDDAALLGHLDALQVIADAHEGHRLAGADGYEASLAWAEALWEAAERAPWREAFEFDFRQQSAPVRLEGPGVPVGAAPIALKDSRRGDVRVPLFPADLTLPPGETANSADSGWQVEDLDARPWDALALVQRGACPYSTMVANAVATGAAAVILFNEGQQGRTETLMGSVDLDLEGVPVVGAGFGLGQALAALAGEELRRAVQVEQGHRVVENLRVDLPSRGAGVLVGGAHLDGGQHGAGINDNGTGVARVVELGQALATRPAGDGPSLRLALGGAEEFGLRGWAAYLAERMDGEIVDHGGTFNLHMVGSLKGARFVYDGDDGAEPNEVPLPEGSGALEACPTEGLEAMGLPWEATAFDGRSDFPAVFEAGIPSGGLFTRAKATMTAEQHQNHGVGAESAMDACYHLRCDDRANADEWLFLEMASAAFYAVDQVRRPPAPIVGRRARRACTAPLGSRREFDDR